MNVHRLEDVPAAAEGRSVALGTFDGVHLGHRRVIAAARDWAREHGTRAGVVTFDPHPLQVLSPEEPPKLLSTTDVKVELLSQLGLDEVIVIPFTRDFSKLEPGAFCDQVLVDRLAARHVSVGANFRFGHGAAGDAETLRSRSEFETEVVALMEQEGRPVSSSRIRDLIIEGAVEQAAELLGAPFLLDGTIVEGDARGRELDMPTANLRPAPELVVPAAGIYAGRAFVGQDGGTRTEAPAATSVGVRPTFDDAGDVRVEAHLIDFEGDLYGRRMQLAFIARLRDEERFESVEALVEQMQRDVEDVRRLTGAAGPS